MATVVIPPIKGAQPLLHKRLLSDGQAQEAVNCKFERGLLEGRRGTQQTTTAATTDRSIYRHGDLGWLKRSVPVNWTPSAVASNVGHFFITGDGYPKQRATNLSERRLGIPRPSLPPTVTINGSPGTDVVRTSSYVFTYVANLGENGEQESAPSPPTGVFDVKTGQTTRIDSFAAPSGAGIVYDKIRIYRTVAGETSSNFYFVGEISKTVGFFDDYITDDEMSTDTLQTATWDAPPDDATGMIYADSGLYAMHRKNELLLSEPYVPYAYPEGYRLSMADTIVSIGQFDGNIVVATTGRPYMVSGTAPEVMSMMHLPFEQACVSRRSMVSVPNAVMYASPDGLCLVSASTQVVATREIFTKEQWAALGPSTLVAAYHEDKYVGFFSGTGKGIVLDVATRDVVTIDLGAGTAVWDVWHDAASDTLYILAVEDGVATVRQWESPNANPMAYRWRSKEFFTSIPVLPAAIRVEGEQTQGNPVTVRVYSGGILRHTATIGDTKTRRLPIGRAEKAWELELSGSAPVSEVRVSTSVEELENGV